MNAQAKIAGNLTPHYAKYVLGLVWALFLAVLVAFAVSSFVAEQGADSSIYLYVAKGILEGDVPYLDRWDHKGPLLYVINLFGLLLHENWGIWFVQGLFLLGASSFAFLSLSKSFGVTPALFALALFLALYGRFATPGNFTEQYGILFQFLALFLFLRSQEQPAPVPTQARFAALHLAIGVLGAASFLLRPNLVAFWIVIGLYWLCQRDTSLRKLAWAVVGGGGVLILVAGFFATIGAWSALWEAVFLYSAAHSDASLQERVEVIRDLATRATPISFLVFAAWCIAIFSLIRKNLHPKRLTGVMLIASMLLPLEIISLTLSGFSGRGFLHYYISALPVLTLLLAFLVWFALKHLPVPQAILSLALLLGSALYLLPDADFARLADKFTRESLIAEDNATRLAIRIRDLTGPDDHILVWGKAARLYLLSERTAPSRFFYHHALIKPHAAAHAYRQEFFADVAENRPKIIVDSRNPRFAPLDSARRANWQSPDRHIHRFMYDLEDFGDFFDFVDANYIAIEETAPYVVYVLSSYGSADTGASRGHLIIRSTYDVYLNGRTLTYVKNPCLRADASNRFILHVIPVDNSVIGGRAHATQDFSFMEGKEWHVGESCVVSVDLPEYPIASIRTGQYNSSRTSHDWLSEYQLPQPR